MNIIEKYRPIAEYILKGNPDVNLLELNNVLIADSIKAGFNPNQRRNPDGTWGNYTQSIESTSNGLIFIMKYNGKVAGSLEVQEVTDFNFNNPKDSKVNVIIDNLFVNKENQREGIATSLVNSVMNQYKDKTSSVSYENTIFEIPYKISFGLSVSDEGHKFIKSVESTVNNFNNNQPKPQK